MTIVCGFIVLRKPDQNYDDVPQAPFYLHGTPPCINEICYSGIVRAPWYELDEGDFKGTLPDNLVKLSRELNETNQPYLDIKLFKDIDMAKEVLEYSNSIQNRYEIASIYSDKLADMKGIVKTNEDITWLGNDVFCYGYGSQLLDGLFSNPAEFSDTVSLINSNGLIDNIDSIESYVTFYNQISSSLNIESIVDIDPSLKDVIRIGRVHL